MGRAGIAPTLLRSLTGKMILGVLAVHLFLIPILFYGVLRIVTDDYKEQFINYARSQSHLLGSLVSGEASEERVALRLSDLLLSGQVIHADLITQSGKALNPWALAPAERGTFREDFFFGQHADSIYYVALPIFDAQDAPLGVLQLGYDERQVEEKISDTYRMGFYLATGYVFLSMLLIGLFGTHLTKSLRRLGAASRRIASGFIEERLSVVSRILEVSNLAQDLEHMRQELVSRGKEIAVREARQRAILETAAEGIITMDIRCFIQGANAAAEKIFGYSAAQMTGRRFTDLLDKSDQEGFVNEQGAPITGIGKELRGRRADGTAFYMLLSISDVEVSGSRLFTALVQDISDRRAFETKLAYMANHDGLTGLPNRTLFRDRLVHAISLAERNQSLVALMFLDLDRFKAVNDALGHEYGDLLLKLVAKRLTGCLRAVDTVCRLGGDEFTVVVEDVSGANDAGALAEKIIDAVGRPYNLRGHEIFIGVSVGVTMYPLDAQDADTLVKNADIAMYRAKEQGRNTYQFFTEELNARALQRMSLEISLRHALERDEFEVHYQPQIDVRSGRIIGMEGLLRWRHPDLHAVPPAQFVPILEDTGLIHSVGEWVLRKACQDNKSLQDAGFAPIRVAVNCSAHQFMQKSIVEIAERALHDSRLSPHYLDLEITEGLLLQNAGSTLEILNRLKDLGVSFSIDDFGVGYSSLSYLKHFPIDALKIDRSFVRDITEDPDDAAIAKAVIVMAHNLDMKVIAEGVENEEQLDFLRAHGCDAAQGYYFSPAVPLEQFMLLLRQNPGRRLTVA